MDDCNAASIKRFIQRLKRFHRFFKLVYVSTCFLVYFQKLIRIFPVRVVVDPVNGPAMLVWIIHQLCKGSIAKAEARARIVRLRSDTDHSVHELVQKTAVRYDQVSGRFAF